MKRLIILLLLCSSIVFAQWQLRNNGLPQGDNYGYAIDAVDQNNAVAGLRVGIYKTTNAGTNWQQISSESIIDISMVSSSTIFAVTLNKIIKTTDGGNTWTTTLENPSSSGAFNFIKYFQGALVALADCNNSTSPAKVYKSTDMGASWQSVNQTSLIGGWSGDIWHRLDFGSANNGVFHVSGMGAQRTFRTSDGGVSWIDTGLDPIMRCLKMYNQSYGLGIGINYTGGVRTGFYVHITRNGGQTWETRNINLNSDVVRAIEFIPNNPSNVFLSTLTGFYFSADSGKTWSNQNINLGSTRCEDIKFVNDNNGWLLCYNGDVYWTNNKGNAVVGIQKQIKIPVQYALDQNYPNPFNPSTNIKFALPEADRVAIKVYDILGQEIKTLLEGDLSAGEHSVIWNGDNSTGQKVSAGIYLYSISANRFTQTRKMVLLK